MSTPDRTGTLPGTPEEFRLGSAVTPSVGSAPTSAAPSPGVALAGARVPGGPTLPDDPQTLGVVISRMFNDLLASTTAPAVTQPQAPASHASAHAPGPAPDAADVRHGVESGDAVAETSPFVLPLNWTAPGLFEPEAAFFVPLIDRGAPPVEPSVALQDDRDSGSVDLALPYEFVAAPASGFESTTPALFDPHSVKGEFPILQERVHGKPLVWLDNAATTQKPQTVIDRLARFYERENSNVHRAAHTLAARATDAYESARESARRFLNAPSTRDIVFVRGTTEGINLVAQSWGRRNVREHDEIVITWLEHHANIVPWQLLCAATGARLRVAPVDDSGQIVLEEYEKLLGPKTRIVAFPQVSNALGTVTPAKAMIELAHRHGARVLVDGAQGASHMAVDVQELDCDFYVFSGHKVFGPTGIGVLFGKADVLEAMPPWQGGGNMIEDVTFERTTYQPAPARFEAGTGNIADAVGLGAALDWLSRLGMNNVSRHEHELLDYATHCLQTVPGLTIIGTASEKAAVISFILAGQKTEQIGGWLDQDGIAVRSGHHCAQPILRRFGLESTVRASLGPYNTREDINALVSALFRLQTGHIALG